MSIFRALVVLGKAIVDKPGGLHRTSKQDADISRETLCQGRQVAPPPGGGCLPLFQVGGADGPTT